jgi:hypothetical protein
MVMTAAESARQSHYSVATVKPAGILDLPIAPIRFIYFQN